MFQNNLIARLVLVAAVLTGLAVLPACGGGGGASSTAIRESNSSQASSSAPESSPAPKPAETSDSDDMAFVSGNVFYTSSGLTKPQSAPDDKSFEKIDNFKIVNVPESDLYVYTVDDTDFSDPVAGPIKTDANGNYTIMFSDFKEGFDPNSQEQYIIRSASDSGPGQKLDVRR
ncbi:MAG: hypothetical protein HZA48_11240 [Planctomycetes bacterium]|nr:hypothetical protein [Planctomycetota bacterium]